MNGQFLRHGCERERDHDSERERIYAARQAISDARLLLETALLLLTNQDEGICA